MTIHDDLHGPGFATRHHGRRVLRIVSFAVGGVVFAVLFALLFGFVVKILWNWLMPGLFGLRVITFWQGFGLVLLAKIFFGGHGYGHGGHGRHFRGRFRGTLKRPAGSEEDAEEDGPIPGDGKQWRHFRKFWQEEGKEAFKAYLHKTEGR